MNIIEKIKEVKKHKTNFIKASNIYNEAVIAYNKNVLRCNESAAFINDYLIFVEASGEELLQHEKRLSEVQLLLDELKELKEPAYSESLKNDYNKYADALKQAEYFKNQIEHLENYVATRTLKINKQHSLYNQQIASLPAQEKLISNLKEQLNTVSNKLIGLKQASFVNGIALIKPLHLEPLKTVTMFEKTEDLQK